MITHSSSSRMYRWRRTLSRLLNCTRSHSVVSTGCRTNERESISATVFQRGRTGRSRTNSGSGAGLSSSSRWLRQSKASSSRMDGLWKTFLERCVIYLTEDQRSIITKTRQTLWTAKRPTLIFSAVKIMSASNSSSSSTSANITSSASSRSGSKSCAARWSSSSSGSSMLSRNASSLSSSSPAFLTRENCLRIAY